MFISSNSSRNATHVPLPLSSSNSSVYSYYSTCLNSTVSNALYTTYTFTNILLFLPLYIFTLYLGFQRWKRQHRVPARTTMSHSDVFTYHMVLMEMIGILGSVLYLFGNFINSEHLLMFGVYAFCIVFPGQTLFHCLTCVERYLAVIHPVTYMRLRETRGVRIRNISIAFAWLLCSGWLGVTKMYLPYFPTILFLSLIGVSIIITLFCCMSVLHVLIRSGPGEVGGNKERVDQSKQRAFHMIMAIAGVLLLRFVGLLVCFGLERLELDKDDLCWLMDSGILLTLPSSLVLPLLFLHRTGKLACCRHNTESEQMAK